MRPNGLVRGEARLTARFPRNINADSNTMSLKKTIQSQGAPPAVGPYSQATTVQAAGLPKGARLEIEAIVHCPGGKS
jgi:hypothetical protein